MAFLIADRTFAGLGGIMGITTPDHCPIRNMEWKEGTVIPRHVRALAAIVAVANPTNHYLIHGGIQEFADFAHEHPNISLEREVQKLYNDGFLSLRNQRGSLDVLSGANCWCYRLDMKKALDYLDGYTHQPIHLVAA